MKRFDLKIMAVLLSSVSFCTASQAFAADDGNKAATVSAKHYKFDKLANGYLFGSFADTDAQADANIKYTNNNKKLGSPGFKIRGLKSLQYKINQNQILDLRKSGLSYVFRVQF
tara:strand:+ start:276 stop:617 length:342 start_codon:yes stop_codon:yes gene_type:complete